MNGDLLFVAEHSQLGQGAALDLTCSVLRFRSVSGPGSWYGSRVDSTRWAASPSLAGQSRKCWYQTGVWRVTMFHAVALV